MKEATKENVVIAKCPYCLHLQVIDPNAKIGHIENCEQCGEDFKIRRRKKGE